MIGEDNKIIPQISNKLPGTIWAITTFFNPAAYKIKKKNYDKFRKVSQQQGLNLVVVELEFGDAPFEIKTDDAEIIIQVRGNEDQIMWQKERLLNIALSKLPEDCDKIIWIDCDILFSNDDWINNTAELLEEYAVVQPFEMVLRLGKQQTVFPNINTVPYGLLDNTKVNSFAYYIKNSLVNDKNLEPEYAGDVGFVWAARREVFSKIGFYDAFIQGSSDAFMAFSFSNSDKFSQLFSSYRPFFEHQKKWQENVQENIKDGLTYTPGIIYHLWHGAYSHRHYNERRDALKKFDFNPNQDIKIAVNGCWEWSSNKTNLHDYLKTHFYNRNENGYWVKEIFIRLKKIKNIKINFQAFLGKIGIIIKKLSPSLYYFLKKIIN